jgi:hypothetical protein
MNKKDDILLLPVSIGEALDKLSILDIKLDYIKDSRRDNVKLEYEMLIEKLNGYIEKTNNYYVMLKKTNQYIWNLMDLLRDGINIEDDKYMKLCKDTIIANDVRFRIKNKINKLTNSLIKEEKGYKIESVLLDLTNYTIDIKLLIKPIIYFSIHYDEIHIKTNNDNIINQIKEECHSILFTEFIDDCYFYKNKYILNDSYIDETSVYNYLGITKKDIEIFI